MPDRMTPIVPTADRRRWDARLLAASLLAFLSLTAPASAVPSTSQTLLTYSTPAASALFGKAVAVSGDATTVIVGASGAAGGGQATVYTCSGATCTAQSDLRALAVGTTSISNKALTSNVATLTTSAAHGYVVGESVVVSGVDATFNGTYTIASVPTSTTFTYSRSASNVASAAATGSATVSFVASGAQFGSQVDLADDGSRALVTAPYSSVGGSNRGSAFVFSRSGTTWSFEARLLEATPTTNHLLGLSGALSGDGTTAAVGSGSANTNRGVVVLYTRSGTTWTLKQSLNGTASCTSCGAYVAADYYDNLGYSVDLSDDGNTLLVAAMHQGTTSTTMGAGAAYVYLRVDPSLASPWVEADRKTLLMSDNSGTARGINDAFGWSVALSSDGTTAAVLDWQSVYKTHIFTSSGGTWSRQASVQATTQGFRESSDVALSGDGNTLLVGLNADDETYTDQGSVALFTRSGSTWTQSSTRRTQASGAAASDYFGNSVDIATSGDGLAAAGAPYGDHTSLSNPGSVTLFAPTDSTAPTLSSSVPADNATGVAVGANIVLTFSEAVLRQTGNITIRKTSDSSTFATIAVTDGQVTGTGTTTITINPTADLASNTGYHVLIDAAAFADAAGNAYAGIASTTALSFTTAAQTDATLSGLATSSGSPAPSFASGTTSYTASVSNATSSLTVTPTVTQASATVQVRANGGSYSSVGSGSASGSLSLNVGANTIDVRVTAEDGTTTVTYSITVTRAASEAGTPPTPSGVGTPPAPSDATPAVTGTTGEGATAAGPRVGCDQRGRAGESLFTYSRWSGGTPVASATRATRAPAQSAASGRLQCAVSVIGSSDGGFALGESELVRAATGVASVRIVVRLRRTSVGRNGSRSFFTLVATGATHFRLAPDPSHRQAWKWRRVRPGFSVGGRYAELWIQAEDTAGRVTRWKRVSLRPRVSRATPSSRL